MQNQRGQFDLDYMQKRLHHGATNPSLPQCLPSVGVLKTLITFYSPLKRTCVFSLAACTTQVDTSAAIRRCAFTLAEVLITLGIIGIVAAMTMPSLIDNHNKKVVEARLQKVHSVMNQAISMAELNYGPRDTWFINNSGYDAKKSWCEKYLIPYLKVVKSGKYDNSNKFYMTFVDGSSLMTAENNFFDWLFFPGNIDNCAGNKTDNYGVCFFPFRYRPVKIPSGDYDAWNFETYAASWNGSTDALKTDSNYGCYSGSKYHGYCTRLIQVNGWKFPKDYPYRVKYR